MSNVDLTKAPIITPGALARPYGVGAGTVMTAADRLGIKPARALNGRLHFSWDQSVRIGTEMQKRAR